MDKFLSWITTVLASIGATVFVAALVKAVGGWLVEVVKDFRWWKDDSRG